MNRTPSTSTRYAPSPRSTKRGVPPTARNARTGELTPPGIRPRARSNSSSDRDTRLDANRRLRSALLSPTVEVQAEPDSGGFEAERAVEGVSFAAALVRLELDLVAARGLRSGGDVLDEPSRPPRRGAAD